MAGGTAVGSLSSGKRERNKSSELDLAGVQMESSGIDQSQRNDTATASET